MLDGPILSSIWPHAPQDLADGICASAQDVFARYGLSSALTVAHAMAQFSEECAGGTMMVEDLDYSAQALMRTWPSRFDAAKAAAYAGDPQRIANAIYDGRNGNLPGSDDGWVFRGRGGSQLTGRGNYATLGQTLGFDLVGDPELAADAERFLEIAVAEFVQRGCLPFAARDDLSGVTFHLNGGFLGLAARRIWLAQWKAVLQVYGVAGHGTLWLQQSLNALGTTPPLILDGSYGPVTVSAVKAFQLAHGLAADGTFGPQTEAAVENALGA